MRKFIIMWLGEKMMDETIKRVIANSLENIRYERGLTVALMADFLCIPKRTFESALYPEHIPPLKKIISVCNHFNFSINDFLGPLIIESTEQKYIRKIYDDISLLPELKQSQLCQILAPYVQSNIGSYPSLSEAKFGRRSRILRKDKKISEGDMSKSCHISKDSLKGIESGQYLPGVDTFLRFCNVLYASPEYLLVNDLSYDFHIDQRLYMLTPSQLEGLSKTISIAARLMS